MKQYNDVEFEDGIDDYRDHPSYNQENGETTLIED